MVSLRHPSLDGMQVLPDESSLAIPISLAELWADSVIEQPFVDRIEVSRTRRCGSILSMPRFIDGFPWFDMRVSRAVCWVAFIG